MTASMQRIFKTIGQLATLLSLVGCATVSQVSTESAPREAASPSPGAASPSAVAQATPSGSQANAQPITARPVTLVENLEHPWGMAWLPDGTLLVTERPGRLRIIRNGQLDPNPIAGVPEVFAVRQGGLLDISVHPQFAENRWVYFTYAAGTPDANQTRVARARFDGTRLTDWTVIFSVDRTKEQAQHFGSRMTWLPDKTLLVSIGDGGNPPVRLDGELIRDQAQNLNTRLGKIVRLNDDGSVPSDNPLVGRPDADPLIWSYGHRNIQGLAFDPDTNRVWSTEHGARGGDELNLVEGGKNYGWPIVTYSREYSGGEISSERSRPDMVDPLAVWTPSKAPSGLAIYRGDRVPQWQGNVFAGQLVSREVVRIEIDESGKVINQTSIAIGQRVRDVRQGPDELLYILTDDANGRLIRLEPSAG